MRSIKTVYGGDFIKRNWDDGDVDYFQFTKFDSEHYSIINGLYRVHVSGTSFIYELVDSVCVNDSRFVNEKISRLKFKKIKKYCENNKISSISGID